MGDAYTRVLVREITNHLREHWKAFREPMLLSCMQSKWSWRLSKAFGAGGTMGWLIGQLEAAKILKVLLTRSGARWIMLKSDWEPLSDLDKASVEAWLSTAIDPRIARDQRRNAG